MTETMNRLETREIKVVNRFDRAEKNCDEKKMKNVSKEAKKVKFENSRGIIRKEVRLME